jgi:hypothetical protein
LVDPAHGGAALKFAKIDLLSPQMVFAIQVKDELEPILQPLRRSLRGRLVVLGPSAAVGAGITQTGRNTGRASMRPIFAAHAASPWSGPTTRFSPTLFLR